MSACERCWAEARMLAEVMVGGMADHYQRLLRERAGSPCTPEEQAGPDATPCEECGGRLVRHQHTGQCMANAAHGYRARTP